MSLDIQQLEGELSHLGISTHVPVHWFEMLPSTDRTAWELLDSAEKPPFAVIASQQSAGRGQYGRQWRSETGGLYLSLALETDLPVDRSPHLVLATVWGIACRLRSYQVPVAIKWPNDLILQGKKLGGIKIETRIRGEKIARVVIGVGINWCNPVPETGIHLQSHGENAIASLEALAAVTIAGILSGYEYYLSHGIERLLTGYLSLFAHLGQEVTIEGQTGVITGVSDRGELKVRISTASASTEICLPTGAIALGYNQ
jgi:BirA family transcriptional regulator, biotin operon repressor / biotin---[acetyl-CoA-carboxylase] ligase